MNEYLSVFILYLLTFAEEKLHTAIWKQAFIALVCIFFAIEIKKQNNNANNYE